MARFVALAVIAVAGTTASWVNAQSWLVLDWSAPNRCEAEPVRAALRSLPRPSSPLAARAQIQEHEGQWTLLLSTQQRQVNGTRRFEGESCEAVQQAVILLVSLALEPVAAPAPVEEPPVWFVGLAAEASFFGLPKPALGVSLSAGRRLGERLDVSVRGALFVSQTESGFVVPESRAEFSRVAMALQGCYSLWQSRLTLSPCVSLVSVRVGARSFGIDRPSQAERWFIGAGGSALLRYSTSRHFSALAELGASLTEAHDFVVAGVPEPVFSAPAFASRLSLGFEAWF